MRPARRRPPRDPVDAVGPSLVVHVVVAVDGPGPDPAPALGERHVAEVRRGVGAAHVPVPRGEELVERALGLAPAHQREEALRLENLNHRRDARVGEARGGGGGGRLGARQRAASADAHEPRLEREGHVARDERRRRAHAPLAPVHHHHGPGAAGERRGDVGAAESARPRRRPRSLGRQRDGAPVASFLVDVDGNVIVVAVVGDARAERRVPSKLVRVRERRRFAVGDGDPARAGGDAGAVHAQLPRAEFALGALGGPQRRGRGRGERGEVRAHARHGVGIRRVVRARHHAPHRDVALRRDRAPRRERPGPRVFPQTRPGVAKRGREADGRLRRRSRRVFLAGSRSRRVHLREKPRRGRDERFRGRDEGRHDRGAEHGGSRRTRRRPRREIARARVFARPRQIQSSRAAQDEPRARLVRRTRRVERAVRDERVVRRRFGDGDVLVNSAVALSVSARDGKNVARRLQVETLRDSRAHPERFFPPRRAFFLGVGVDPEAVSAREPPRGTTPIRGRRQQRRRGHAHGRADARVVFFAGGATLGCSRRERTRKKKKRRFEGDAHGERDVRKSTSSAADARAPLADVEHRRAGDAVNV